MTTLDDIQQAAEGARCPDCTRLLATTAHEQTLASRCNGSDSHGCLRHQVARERAGNDQRGVLLDFEKGVTERFLAELKTLRVVATEAAAMLAETNHGGLSHLRSVSLEAALATAGVSIPFNCSACPHPGRDKRIAELEAALQLLLAFVEEADNLANMTDAHTRRHYDATRATLAKLGTP